MKILRWQEGRILWEEIMGDPTKVPTKEPKEDEKKKKHEEEEEDEGEAEA